MSTVQTTIRINPAALAAYPDVYTPETVAALEALAGLDTQRAELMDRRIRRRTTRANERQPLDFLAEDSVIEGTGITVADARAGRFTGPVIPADLRRQWIQGTGPSTKPQASVASGLRNVAYALLSGADGWMFDGEDALGQTGFMSLDAQRNLRLMVANDPQFLDVAEQVAGEMNEWARGFLGREIIGDWREQLGFTTRIFRCRGLHLDDRHLTHDDGRGFSASITDLVLYVVHNHRDLAEQGRSIVLYLPKIQTAAEAAHWGRLMDALEDHLGLTRGTILGYVLVEQVEASFQLMEIRAALGLHFVGFNTGRWDYINSVSDAMAWDPEFTNPNIDAITMTYAYMRAYEDRVRRAVNTPDAAGNFALWQGGMEPNIPVGSEEGVATAMTRAVGGGEREQREGASGKWVAHWKMVHIMRPVWERVGDDNQLGREFPALTYTAEDARALTQLEDAPRTVRGARDLLSVGLQYGNAFGQGFQAAALKPADFFGDDSVLYLMEDAATGEIRLSVLWEWLHKSATFTADDDETGVRAGDPMTAELFERLLDEEYHKLVAADGKDVHEVSKTTTLPIAREIVRAYVTYPVKAPWYIDLLNLNLNNHDLREAEARIERYLNAFADDGTRITWNLDLAAAPTPSDHPITSTNEGPDMTIDQTATDIQQYMDGDRFAGIKRLYSARQVAEQRGTIPTAYPIARDNAAAFHTRLRELFSEKKSITTFGPYSPSQAVTMKRMGMEGIYLGGWATSAKGSVTEDPGADLASYPLSQVPDEAAGIVRALLTADRNQTYLRARMRPDDLAVAPAPVDYRPFIIADADTGHGGDAHVRNLIRRFVEVGVTGYHIEDQRPGTKKCGHQGGKVLVGVDEQIKRLNAARFQLDIMGVPGLIVARTDAEAATLLDNNGDERDHPFVLGATNPSIPSYKLVTLALMRAMHTAGTKVLSGFQLYTITDEEYAAADAWLEHNGLMAKAGQAATRLVGAAEPIVDETYDGLVNDMVGLWEAAAGLMTIGEAVANRLQLLAADDADLPISEDEWREFAADASFWMVRDKARELGIDFYWNADVARTPEGFYQVRGGIEYAIRKSLSVAPYADIIWMETASADIREAEHFARAMHEVFPDKMLAYNLSPSFNWDSTGMTDDEMREFPAKLGAAGFVFNFITYGGHQIDGVAGEEFASALMHDGMLALAKVQRRIRLLESPYRTPQTHVGGPRLDAALAACSARTATTKAMGKGSTQTQHLVQTELPKKVLEDWLAEWAEFNGLGAPLQASLRPSREAPELLELAVYRGPDDKVHNIVFAPINDRHGRTFISVRDQNTFDDNLRKKRLSMLVHLYMIQRFKADAVHYVSPTEANAAQCERMKAQGLYSDVATELGNIIVARVSKDRMADLTAPNSGEMSDLISRADVNA
ncbi:isocitrate lyase/phosphoenolpyruvate mutase family protein [Tessaracoccus sp. ZS01]|uniref:isocitrate lyase/phosphoenolpyruvate mutase family protein n=1 Tax=Tessaracoccus sp. ZS01 TaxID=1906324 RepID=UPI0018E9E53E|nr:isocitrate lyase/phosphoenolpyruvate mutase family protein [Tessaracoccus sp. ZS01]